MNGLVLPWKDKTKFRDEMLLRDVAAYQAVINMQEPVFFDRGIPDLIGYSRLESIELTDELKDHVQKFRYNKVVFVAPPWEEIYRNDSERKQSYKEAIATYDALVKAYANSAYELIEIPKLIVQERVEFLLSVVDKTLAVTLTTS